VPAIIKDLDDTEAMEIALIENLQREDLNAIEEAEGYQTLIDIYGLTQENVAVRVGKSRPAVTNALRLLNLPETVRDMVKNGELSQGHARTLLSLDNPVEMKTIAEDIVKKGLTVRNVEKIVKDKESAPKEKTEKERPKPVGVLVSEVERGLTEYLGRRVTVTEGKNKGIIEIEYYGDEDLKGLIRLIAKD
jgi:ParB family chromosome partitioning protein